MKPIALLTTAACLLANAGSASAFFVAPPLASQHAATALRAAAGEQGEAVTRQQQLGGLVRGLGLAGLGAAFLSGGCVSCSVVLGGCG